MSHVYALVCACCCRSRVVGFVWCVPVGTLLAPPEFSPSLYDYTSCHESFEFIVALFLWSRLPFCSRLDHGSSAQPSLYVVSPFAGTHPVVPVRSTMQCYSYLCGALGILYCLVQAFSERPHSAVECNPAGLTLFSSWHEAPSSKLRQGL